MIIIEDFLHHLFPPNCKTILTINKYESKSIHKTNCNTMYHNLSNTAY